MTFTLPQSYPPPTELPAMRAGEQSGRYMDCSPALNPIDDKFTNITAVTITVSRWDGQSLGADDLQQDIGFQKTLDATGTIATFGWIAPSTNPGRTYLLNLTAPTASGEIFTRDWMMSIVPAMG